MISAITDALTDGANRGKSALMRKPQVQRFMNAPIWDWVIPSTLVVIIVVSLAWVFIVGN